VSGRTGRNVIAALLVIAVLVVIVILAMPGVR